MFGVTSELLKLPCPNNRERCRIGKAKSPVRLLRSPKASGWSSGVKTLVDTSFSPVQQVDTSLVLFAGRVFQSEIKALFFAKNHDVRAKCF